MWTLTTFCRVATIWRLWLSCRWRSMPKMVTERSAGERANAGSEAGSRVSGILSKAPTKVHPSTGLKMNQTVWSLSPVVQVDWVWSQQRRWQMLELEDLCCCLDLGA